MEKKQPSDELFLFFLITFGFFFFKLTFKEHQSQKVPLTHNVYASC